MWLNNIAASTVFNCEIQRSSLTILKAAQNVIDWEEISAAGTHILIPQDAEKQEHKKLIRVWPKEKRHAHVGR